MNLCSRFFPGSFYFGSQHTLFLNFSHLSFSLRHFSFFSLKSRMHILQETLQQGCALALCPIIILCSILSKSIHLYTGNITNILYVYRYIYVYIYISLAVKSKNEYLKILKTFIFHITLQKYYRVLFVFTCSLINVGIFDQVISNLGVR